MRTNLITAAGCLLLIAGTASAEPGKRRESPLGGPEARETDSDRAQVRGERCGDRPRGERTRQGKLRAIARRIDANDDRHISDAELDVAVQKMLERIVAKKGEDLDAAAVEIRIRKKLTMLQGRVNQLGERGEGAQLRDQREGAGSKRAKLMERFDRDGDGQLSQDERAAAREKMGQIREGMRERTYKGRGIRAAIGSLDSDNSRSISQAELATGFELIQTSDERFDLNRDGVVDSADAVKLTQIAEKINSRAAQHESLESDRPRRERRSRER